MENLSDISVIRALLERHGFRFSKSLGQNFLTNPTVCPRMAEECGAGKGVGVLEIGPGFGVLTQQLALRASKVVAVELDNRLIPVLDETLSEFGNVTVVEGDILKLDASALISEHFEGLNVVVCANLPYYITSPVIMKLLEERLPIENMTVMVQKEAADRLCAPVGSRESGAVTAAVSYYAEPEKLFTVSAGSFMPPPKVDSAVIRLKIRKTPPVSPQDEKFFFSVIRAAFSQRRKTSLNAISSGLQLPKDVVAGAFASCGLDGRIRAERITLEQFAAVSDALCRTEKI